MGLDTKIEWCDSTFNPWVGCSRVSDGCRFCYAEALMDTHYKKVNWGPNGERKRTAPANWRRPLKWTWEAEAAGERRRVFCASLADVFEDRDELVPWREELFQLIDATPALDWLLLTKRPENIVRMTPKRLMPAGNKPIFPGAPGKLGEPVPCFTQTTWRENVWLGTSVENEETANERIPPLVSIQPVPTIRFLSCEPLLGPIDLGLMQMGGDIDWVIVGGESGHYARSCRVDWIESIRDQCQAAAVPVFIKQLGAKAVICDEETGGCPVHLDLPDKKGGDWSEWPEDLRVREFPSVEVSALPAKALRCPNER